MKVYRDPLLKMVHNPGGHWNPGRGPHPIYIYIYMGVSKNTGTPKWMLYNGKPY